MSATTSTKEKETMLEDIHLIFMHYRQCGDDGNTTRYIDVIELYKKIKNILTEGKENK